MIEIKYFKAEPTEFARMSVSGNVKKKGEGISGFYLPFQTTIEMVPVTASDQPFAFKEFSNDSQEVTLQGGFVYRIADPEAAMAKYNFSVDPKTKKYYLFNNSRIRIFDTEEECIVGSGIYNNLKKYLFKKQVCCQYNFLNDKQKNKSSSKKVNSQQILLPLFP